MLLDTSGFLCLLHRSETFHEQARGAYQSASSRLTTDYVLAELIDWRPCGVSLVQPCWLSSESCWNPDIETVWVDESLHRSALALLSERQDKTYSLCDAVSFVLMRQRGLVDALTTDHHFQQEGFRFS